MISASAYIIACTAKNRLRKRLQRLREPRYLIGAVVGGAYIYFSFFARPRAARRAAAGRGRPAGAGAATAAAIAASGPAFVGGALLLLATVAWVLPFNSGLLDFSAAETDLLFPAPVTRRQLLLHRLLRSQIGILFGSAIVAFASPVPGWYRLRLSIATWIMFVTMRVYFTAVTLARSRGMGGGRTSAVAWAPLAACLVAVGIVGVSTARTLLASPVQSARDVFDRLGAVSLRGPVHVVLWPFLAIARPLFATSAATFVSSLVGAGVVLAAAVLWMLRSDEAFQDAASHVAARRAERQQARGAAVRARATGLTLALTGRPEPALFWKNGVQTLRLAGISAIRIVIAFTGITIAVTSMVVNTMHLRGWGAAACAVAMAIAAFTAMLGPQVVRTDLRSDLQHLELLKTWPVRPAAMVRGEMAWPASMLTAIGWTALACAAAFSPAAFPRVPPATRLSAALAAAMLMPALVCAQYLVQNAAALAFPGWVPLGNQRPRGVDAMGQRLIMLGGTLLIVVLLMIPGALVGGAIWFAFERWLGAAVFVLAAAACTTIVLVEILAATELLAPLFDRLDILAVEHTE